MRRALLIGVVLIVLLPGTAHAGDVTAPTAYSLKTGHQVSGGDELAQLASDDDNYVVWDDASGKVVFVLTYSGVPKPSTSMGTTFTGHVVAGGLVTVTISMALYNFKKKKWKSLPDFTLSSTDTPISRTIDSTAYWHNGIAKARYTVTADDGFRLDADRCVLNSD